MLPLRRIPFGIARHGLPLKEVGLKRKYNPGIVIYTDIEGMVPDYEVREAAVYCNYTPQQFYDDLDYIERAKVVAQYREHHRIEANMSDAAEAASNARNNNK